MLDVRSNYFFFNVTRSNHSPVVPLRHYHNHIGTDRDVDRDGKGQYFELKKSKDRALKGPGSKHMYF